MGLMNLIQLEVKGDKNIEWVNRESIDTFDDFNLRKT